MQPAVVEALCTVGRASIFLYQGQGGPRKVVGQAWTGSKVQRTVRDLFMAPSATTFQTRSDPLSFSEDLCLLPCLSTQVLPAFEYPAAPATQPAHTPPPFFHPPSSYDHET